MAGCAPGDRTVIVSQTPARSAPAARGAALGGAPRPPGSRLKGSNVVTPVGPAFAAAAVVEPSRPNDLPCADFSPGTKSVTANRLNPFACSRKLPELPAAGSNIFVTDRSTGTTITSTGRPSSADAGQLCSSSDSR